MNFCHVEMIILSQKTPIRLTFNKLIVTELRPFGLILEKHLIGNGG